MKWRGAAHTLPAIIIAAVAVRLAYLHLALGTPLFEVLLIDSEFYDRRAREIAAGDGLGDEPFFMNPLYPYFMAAIYAVFGFEYWAVGMVQALLGAMGCYMLYEIGTQLWRRQVGLIAAGLAAFYGPYVFYDGALLTASPITCLNLVGLYALLRSRESGSPRWLWAAGLAFGVSALARPLVLLYVVVLGGWYAWRAGWPGLCRWGRIGAGCGLVVVAVIVRNFAVGGEWLLTTSSAGMNFYVGNHPGANGIYAQVDFLPSAEPDLERTAFIREASARTGETMTPGMASRYWLWQGLGYAWENPVAYLQLLGRKFYMFWNSVEAQNNLSIYMAQDFVPLLRWLVIGWWILVPMAVANWILSARGDRAVLLDLYLLVYLAGCMVFFVSSEYRLPAVTVILLYAARWLWAGANCLARGNYPPLVRSVLLAALIAIPVNYKDADADRLTLKRVDYYNFGTLYQRRGDDERAAEMYLQALRIDPAFAPARAGLNSLYAERPSPHPAAERGLALYTAGDYRGAIDAFVAVVAAGMAGPELYNNLGLSHYRLAQYGQALQYYQRALAADSNYVRAYFNTGLALVKTGDDLGAERAFARAIELDPGHAKAHYRRGAALSRLGRLAAAEKHWSHLKRAYPGDERLRAKIDSIIGATGRR